MGREAAAGIQPGDTLVTVMLGPCVGGLLRTWATTGSRLWGVPDPSSLVSLQGRGIIARTLREKRRYREVAFLHEPSGTLLLQPRVPPPSSDGTFETTATAVQLTDPGPPGPSPWQDLEALLGRAVRHTVETDGFLVVERGGWDAPLEPYCMFLVMHDAGDVSVVEAAPAPLAARLWQQSIEPGASGATMTAPATERTLAAASTLMVDACATWGLEPWDLGLTFGDRR